MENQETIIPEDQKTPPVETKQPQQLTPAAIKINAQGLVESKDNGELLRYCHAMVTSEMVPKQFNTPQKLFGALMFVRSLGLPDTSIRQVAVIQGVPSTFGDLSLAMVQKSGELSYFLEQWFDDKYDVLSFENKNLKAEPWGAVCILSRQDSEKQSFSFTLDDARKAGTYPSNSASPWTKHTRIMLRYKARAIALKSVFADKLNGVSIAEHDFDALPSEEQDIEKLKDVTIQPKGLKKSNFFEGKDE